MRLSFHPVTPVSLLLGISYCCFIFIPSNDRSLFAEAAKLRKGSVTENDELDDISLALAGDAMDRRSLLSFGDTLTDVELFALKKTPPALLKSSKCGGTGTLFRSIGNLRKHHPGCLQFDEEDSDQVPGTLPPIGGPTIDEPTAMPSTFSPTTPLPTLVPTTPLPSAAPTKPLNCVQTVVGNSELLIPVSAPFQKGNVHCLVRLEDGASAYFGYNWSNQFGLFVNGQPVWTAPDASVAASDRWVFQSDGNMLLRDANNQGIWRTHTGGNWNSQMKVSFERVWIETNSGNTVWFQPLITPMPSAPPQEEDLPTISPSYGVPTTSPTFSSAMPSGLPTPLPTGSTTMPSALPTAVPSILPTTSPSGSTPMPSASPTGLTPTTSPSTPYPSTAPTRLEDKALNCVQTVMGNQLTIPSDTSYRKGEVHCLVSQDGEATYFGYTWTNQFGLFSKSNAVWSVPSSILLAANDDSKSFDRWSFQEDGNLVLRDANGGSIWTSESYGNFGSHLRMTFRQ
ncbi:MAG: hypothetical protein SGBAC_012260, partial [Bacillariaceae sp.]